MASSQTLSSFPHPSTAPPLSPPTVMSPPLLSSSSPQLPSSLPKSSTESGPEVGSLFAYEPHILEPFMGLIVIDRPNDPWHHKNHDPHQPLYTGTGSFGRYKRDLATAPTSQASDFARNRQVITPEMLVRILNIRSNFKKRYPLLYKLMMSQLMDDKSTTISITRPEVPQQVSDKNFELPAAQVNSLESLMHTYEENLEKITRTQKQQQQSSEFNFRSNPRDEILSDAPNKEEYFLTPMPEIITQAPFYKNSSFWDDPQKFLTQIDEERNFKLADNQLPPGEPSSFWKNSQENPKAPTESQLVFQNPQQQITSHEPAAIAQDVLQDYVNYGRPSFWENPLAVLKDLNGQPISLYDSQNTAVENNNLWEIPDKPQSADTDDAYKQPIKIRTSGNDKNDGWRPPSVLQKRSSFWTRLEAEEEEKENKKRDLDDSEPIFNFNVDFN